MNLIQINRNLKEKTMSSSLKIRSSSSHLDKQESKREDDDLIFSDEDSFKTDESGSPRKSVQRIETIDESKPSDMLTTPKGNEKFSFKLNQANG